MGAGKSKNKFHKITDHEYRRRMVWIPLVDANTSCLLSLWNIFCSTDSVIFLAKMRGSASWFYACIASRELKRNSSLYSLSSYYLWKIPFLYFANNNPSSFYTQPETVVWTKEANSTSWLPLLSLSTFLIVYRIFSALNSWSLWILLES